MKEIFLGNTPVNVLPQQVKGDFVEIENEKFYKISNYHQMPDFFMTIVSASNHWMYISSNGSLSAGRRNRDNALFPYYTEDKIHDYKGKTGSATICLVHSKNKKYLWEPFTDEAKAVYKIERNLYKSIYGNKIIFEERNLDLEISFSYGWYNSEEFGWIKKSLFHNFGKSEVKIDVLDGIHNILPYGADYAFQNEYSNLLDAYKKNELLEGSNLGLFSLSSIPVDRAEPSEALKTTTVWSLVPGRRVNCLISDKQIDKFRKGQPVFTERDVRAARGAYYINTELSLGKNEHQNIYLVAEVNQDAKDVANLVQFIHTEENLVQKLESSIETGTQELVKIVANADGLQQGNEEMGVARHFSNTLFNVMRGGIYSNSYRIEKEDFLRFVEQTNREIYDLFSKEFQLLSAALKYRELLDWAEKMNNPVLERICYEYLPLTFSRRHGDPSRPWNKFSIETKNEDGSDKLNYEGNWRDIFQNWEALNYSFPEYIEGIIAKFVNASTADGYNPYRITRGGIDWECPDPDDPWAYIGYWGDHQIVYLLKFLEQSEKFHPGKLDELLTKNAFVYANVPYRIKPFDALVENPKSTIIFDSALNSKIQQRSREMGADGKLLCDSSGQIYRVNLMEKILATLLSKLSNFIPEAGIWMNTQRPEWNDANNALVGNGASMVTLYYLRGFLAFWKEKLKKSEEDKFEISEELAQLFGRISLIFQSNSAFADSGFYDEDRYRFAASLGRAGSEYRNAVYKNSFSGKKTVLLSKSIIRFIRLALKYIDQSIKKNRREDGLYHAYNLIAFNGESITVRYLYEMLEGQVAVLSSGYLSVAESLNVLDALKSSLLFREDQYSYILYPDRELPRFTEKNNIPATRIKESELLKALVADNRSEIVKRDDTGGTHFNGAFRNADVLNEALDKLDKNRYGELLRREKQLVLDVYEEMFDHQSFTGRSGTFFAYEGLGSIYWHMVSKLLMAVQECYFRGVKEDAGAEIIGWIKQHYYEIKAGIGLYKSPDLYGAFPTDAYSHTPANAGAKQPGLTGQVKEDFISRFGELGIHIKSGEIVFLTTLLNSNELLTEPQVFHYIDLNGKNKSVDLKPGQLAFTFCQVPVVYSVGEAETIAISYKNGHVQYFNGHAIDKLNSSKIFARSGEIEMVEFSMNSNG
ncbi:hypothetical protein SAMN05444274_103451 [Mariniphaga anaerophila]|uniref:Cellobiose phosphorylase n=1 Tax=Mariniphaga anaerophila TaxID=1484053 RepID=A0A1M4YSL5_9BACT|nr:hypothetical protein [Mariniphaga anaerophila]SHF08780.1 hypothetical protein SAMN05444274_103451 [Mariniphaga anaerophila]